MGFILKKNFSHGYSTEVWIASNPGIIEIKTHVEELKYALWRLHEYIVKDELRPKSKHLKKTTETLKASYFIPVPACRTDEWDTSQVLIAI